MPAVGDDGTIYVVGAAGELIALNPDGTVKWSVPSANAGSSPAIAPDGSIYVGTAAGLTSFSPNGAIQWQSELGQSQTAPAVAPDGTVYATQPGALLALNPDATEKWAVREPTALFHLACVAPDGTILVTGTATGDAFVAKLNSDGVEQWRFRRPFYDGGGAILEPAVAPDGTIFFGLMERRPVPEPDGSLAFGKLYVLDPSGEVKWTILPETSWSLVQPPVSTRDGDVFVTAGANLYRRHTSGRSAAVIQFWTALSAPALTAEGTLVLVRDYSELVGISTNGTVRWQGKLPSVHVPPVLTPQGVALVGSYDGRLIAIQSDGPPAPTAWSMSRANARRDASLAPRLPPSAPDAARTLTVGSPSENASTQTVLIAWTSAARAVQYDVWRHTNETFAGATRIATNIAVRLQWLDTPPGEPNRFVYWVTAKNPVGSSSPSEPARLSLPGAPTALTATEGALPLKVKLTWPPVPGASAYEIWRSERNDLPRPRAWRQACPGTSSPILTQRLAGRSTTGSGRLTSSARVRSAHPARGSAVSSLRVIWSGKRSSRPKGRAQYLLPRMVSFTESLGTAFCTPWMRKAGCAGKIVSGPGPQPRF